MKDLDNGCFCLKEQKNVDLWIKANFNIIVENPRL